MTATPRTELRAGDSCALCGARGEAGVDHDGNACMMCGGPRVVVTEAIERPRAEKKLLERAKRRRLERAGWGVAASLSMALGGAVLAVGAVLALMLDFGTTAQAAFGTAVVTPLFFSALGFYRSRRAGRDARSAVEAAEAVVAGELVAARGSIDAPELARLMKISVDRAEQLIAATQVERMLDGGERLRVEEAAPPPELESETAENTLQKRGRE